MSNRFSSVFKFACLFILLMIRIPASVFAQEQEPELSISLRRDFGYGGFGNDIEGLFTIRSTGPENLVRVSFFLDDQLMAEVTEPPFNYQFRTNDYDLGQHTLSAIGQTGDGTELRSNEISAIFVAPEVGRNTTVTIVLVLLGLILAATLISALVTFFTRRGQTASGSVPVSYGALGGTVCPNCYKPYSRHWWGFNVIVGKLDRCPHCGKWRITRRATPEELRLAEEMLLQDQKKDVVTPASDVDRDVQRELDESKYLD